MYFDLSFLRSFQCLFPHHHRHFNFPRLYPPFIIFLLTPSFSLPLFPIPLTYSSPSVHPLPTYLPLLLPLLRRIFPLLVLLLFHLSLPPLLPQVYQDSLLLLYTILRTTSSPTFYASFSAINFSIASSSFLFTTHSFSFPPFLFLCISSLFLFTFPHKPSFLPPSLFPLPILSNFRFLFAHTQHFPYLPLPIIILPHLFPFTCLPPVPLPLLSLTLLSCCCSSEDPSSHPPSRIINITVTYRSTYQFMGPCPCLPSSEISPK